MGAPAINTSPTKSPSKPITPSLRSPVTDKIPRPILKRKSTPGTSSLLGSARQVEREIIQDSKPDMAASFLQFCAMCENQIMTPCNSILYCSEACRRKDSLKPLQAAIITTVPISPPVSEPSSPKPILSPRLPTGVSESSFSSHQHPSPPTISFPPTQLHTGTSDLDPTEWKPKLPARTHSEAHRYLASFHRSLTNTSTSGTADTTTSTSTNVPSLSFTSTPTTAGSSLSTSAGITVGAVPLHRYSTSHNGYDFATRPLPTRQHRWYGLSSGTPKGVDLVTPHVVPSSAVAGSGIAGSIAAENGSMNVGGAGAMYDDADGLRWEKRKVMFANPIRGDDGLSVLFAERK